MTDDNELQEFRVAAEAYEHSWVCDRPAKSCDECRAAPVPMQLASWLVRVVDRCERAEARAEDAEQDTKDIGESLRRAHATLAGACETCDADGLMYVTAGVHPWGEEVEEATTCAECNGTGKSWIAELKARAEAAERRVAELAAHIEEANANAPTALGDALSSLAAASTRAANAERRVQELEGRLEDRTNAWHDRDLRSGAETERAAIVADLRRAEAEFRRKAPYGQGQEQELWDHADLCDSFADRIASGAHHSSKEGGADE